VQPAPVPGQRPAPDEDPADVHRADRRLVSIELTGEVTRVRSNFVNRIKMFPVRVHPLTPEVEH